jgi:hypothetical protein
MTDTRSEYISKAKENLELINTRLAELEAKADKKTGDVRREFKAKLSGIKESRDQATRRLEVLRLASKPPRAGTLWRLAADHKPRGLHWITAGNW